MRARLVCSLCLLVGCAGAATGPGDDGPGPLDGAVEDGAMLDGALADGAPDPAMPDAAAHDAGHPRDGGTSARDAGTPDARVARGAPYPIVLAHGFFGFEDFAGAGFVDYFWRVRAALHADGEPDVFTPAVDPFNDSTVRGTQLIAHIERILEETGHDKVNLVGHSQGGLDARVVAHLRPDLLASVTTIATPHDGSPVADIVLGLVENPRARELVDVLARAIAAPLYTADGAETSVFTSLRQLSSEGAAELRRTYWDAASVPFFSIGGRSDRHFGGRACQAEDSPEFITRWRLTLDPIDPLLSLPESLIDGGLGGPDANDGLVRAEDSHFGTFLGCIPADHLDQIGQLFGDDPGLANGFDHREFYRELVRWLRSRGY